MGLSSARAAKRISGHGGQSSEHRAGPGDSLQEARDVCRWHEGPTQGLRTGDKNLKTSVPCVPQLSQGMAPEPGTGELSPSPISSSPWLQESSEQTRSFYGTLI